VTFRQDLTIRQGETWSFVYTHKDGAGSVVDLTGYTARAAIKVDFAGATEVYLSTGSDAIGGSIALGGAAGTVTLSMTADQTTSLLDDLSYYALVASNKRAPVAPSVTWRYDLELVASNGTVTRALEGLVTIYRQVTGVN
jgi:hypothetical protein